MIRVNGTMNAAPVDLLRNGTVADRAIQAGENISLTPVVRSTTVTITSTGAAGAGQTTVYLWNNSYLQTVTDNGGGANTISYNWEDGFTGELTSQNIKFANGGKGQTLYGGYITCTATTAGTTIQDETGLENSSPLLLQYIGRGTASIPTIIEVNDNFSRSDFSVGIGVFTCMQPFNQATQLQLDINGDTTATTDYAITVKLYFFPNFKM